MNSKTMTKQTGSSVMKKYQAKLEITERGGLWYHKIIGKGWTYTDNRGRSCWLMCKNHGINIATSLNSEIVSISKNPKD